MATAYERDTDIKLADHDVKIAVLEQHCQQFTRTQDRIAKDVAAILASVNGNGTPGLKTNMETTKSSMNRMWGLFVTCLVVGVPAVLGLFYLACSLPTCSK